MAIAVRVQAKVTGHRRAGMAERELALPLGSGAVSARDLIEAAVTAEVADFERRAGEAQLVRVLTEQSLADDLRRGAVRMGDHEPVGALDLKVAIATAMQAFTDGIFKIFVGDDEVDETGTVDIYDGAELLFLRLVPLAGG